MTILLAQRSQQERKRLNRFVCFFCAEPIRHLVSGMVNGFSLVLSKEDIALEGNNLFVDGKG